MSVKIIIDSTADITSEVRNEVTVVPLTVYFGEEEYIDGVTINHKEFYEKLISSDVVPTTSQVTPAKFSEAFENATEDGSEVVVITIASKLSGTYQSAVIAAEEFAGKVFVVDSKTVTLGIGILAELAIGYEKSGMCAKEIAEKLEKDRENVCLVAILDTLEYLKRGGRISKTVALAGTLLSIKPVINISDGEINILGKARGIKQGNNLMIKEIEKQGGVAFDKPYMLGYTGISDGMLMNFIKDTENMWDRDSENLKISMVGSVVGTHAGPGAVAVAYYKNNK